MSEYTYTSLFEKIEHMAIAFIENDALNIIPHQVIAHGYGEWRFLVAEAFPELGWRGYSKEEYPFAFYEWILYDRYFINLSKMPCFKALGSSALTELKLKGWKEFLDD